jgi:hypothetical protein
MLTSKSLGGKTTTRDVPKSKQVMEYKKNDTPASHNTAPAPTITMPNPLLLRYTLIPLIVKIAANPNPATKVPIENKADI